MDLSDKNLGRGRLVYQRRGGEQRDADGKKAGGTAGDVICGIRTAIREHKHRYSEQNADKYAAHPRVVIGAYGFAQLRLVKNYAIAQKKRGRQDKAQPANRPEQHFVRDKIIVGFA